MISIHLLPHALSELFVDVTTSKRITLADRYGMLAALLDESVDTEEIRSIDRLLHALSQGRLQIVSDLSALMS